MLSAVLLPYRRIYLVTAAMDDDLDGLDESGSRKPSAVFTPMTLYRLAVTIMLTVGVITISISKGDLYFLLRIALLQMAIDIAPMEARIVLPPIGVFIGLMVDLYLQGFFATSLLPGSPG